MSAPNGIGSPLLILSLRSVSNAMNRYPAEPGYRHTKLPSVAIAPESATNITHSFQPQPNLSDCQPLPPRYFPAPPEPGNICLPKYTNGSSTFQISMSPISPSGFHKAAEWLTPSFTALAPTPHAALSKLFMADSSPYWS